MEYPLNIYITAHTLISSLGFGISENRKAIHDYRRGIRMQEAGRISDSQILAGMIDSESWKSGQRSWIFPLIPGWSNCLY